MPKYKRQNLRQELFFTLYLAIGNASEAYRQAGYKSRSPHVDACKLLAKPSSQAKLAEIKAKSGLLKTKSREDVLQWLSDLMDRPARDLPAVSDQVRAGELMGKMCGWTDPETGRTVNVNTLTVYLQELRQQKLDPGTFRVIENGDDK